MAEEETTPDETPPKKGGLAVLAIVIVLAMILGSATPFIVDAVASGETETEEPEPSKDVPLSTDELAFIEFGETVVNLADGARTRYLQVKMSLQVEKAQLDDITKVFEAKQVILQNWMLTYLSDKTLDDIRGAAGLNRLRREILDHFNDQLFPDGYDRIHDVLFTKVAVQ